MFVYFKRLIYALADMIQLSCVDTRLMGETPLMADTYEQRHSLIFEEQIKWEKSRLNQRSV